jgi:hypothetical protein
MNNGNNVMHIRSCISNPSVSCISNFPYIQEVVREDAYLLYQSSGTKGDAEIVHFML